MSSCDLKAISSINDFHLELNYHIYPNILEPNDILIVCLFNKTAVLAHIGILCRLLGAFWVSRHAFTWAQVPHSFSHTERSENLTTALKSHLTIAPDS